MAKKVTTEDLDRVAKQVHDYIVDSDGFLILEPTDEKGKALIAGSVKTKSKIVTASPKKSKAKKDPQKTDAEPSTTEVIVLEPAWSLPELDKNLAWAVKQVEKGRFEKVMKGFQKRKALEEYINHILFLGDLRQGKEYQLELTVLDRIIRIGKTFFEYFEKEEGFIDNFRYDGLLAILKKHEDEPTGYTPEGKRGKLETSTSDYSSLAINMNKCYINRKDDPLPTGVKETDSVEAWLRRGYRELGLDESDEITIVAAPKLDGVALRGEIDFDNRINKPLLRGDEKKSILVKGLDGLKLSDGASISKTPFGCQFEAFVTYENLEKASEYLMKEEKIEKPYVSPRHAASGIMNRLCGNPDNKLAKFLSFYPINAEDLDGSYLDRLDKIKQLGNVEVVRTRLLRGNLKSLLDRIELQFNKLNSQRASLPYAIDGLVLAFADDAHQDQLGRSGRTNKWQIALKFDPSSAVGEVKGIELSSGKKGFRTIQVVLKEPVSIDGVRYDHVPALSADIFEKFNLCEGDLIRIHRVGDVIPSISIEERKGGKKIELPKKCPVCGKDMIWEAKKLKCTNVWCEANLAGALLTFFNYANIKGVGDAEAEALVNSGLSFIEVIAGATINIVGRHSLKLDNCIFEYSWESAGYTTESAGQLQTAVRDALHNMWDYEFIGNRGIPGIGPETAKKVFMSIRKSDPDATVKASDLIETFQKKTQPDVVDGSISTMWNDCTPMCSIALKFADRFCKHSTPEHFANLKSVGHTGGNPSKEAKQLIRDLGWELVDGKKFDYLIVPSYNHESTKTKVAKGKGIEMFTEEDFVEEFNDVK